MRAAMHALTERGITRVLVEGGAAIAEAVLRADLVDEALIYRGVARATAETIRPFGARGIAALTDHEALRPYAERLIGRDRLSVYRRGEFW